MAHKNAQWRYLDKFSHHSSSKTATLLPSHTIICQGVIVYNFYSYSNPIPPSLSPRWPRWHSLTSPEFQNLGGWSLHEKWCLILDVRFSSLSVTKVDVRRTFFSPAHSSRDVRNSFSCQEITSWKIMNCPWSWSETKMNGEENAEGQFYQLWKISFILSLIAIFLEFFFMTERYEKKLGQNHI